MLVSYYLPGNSLAPPPSHRESAATAHVVVEHAISGSVIFHQTRGRWLSGGAPTFSFSWCVTLNGQRAAIIMMPHHIFTVWQ